MSDFFKIREKSGALTLYYVVPYVGHLRQKYRGSFPLNVVRDLETWLLCGRTVKALSSWTSSDLIQLHSRDSHFWSCDILTVSSTQMYFFFLNLLKHTGLFLGVLSDNICWVFMVSWTAGGKENRSWEINLDYGDSLTYCWLHRPALCIALCIPSKVLSTEEFVINRHWSNRLLFQIDNWLISNNL